LLKIAEPIEIQETPMLRNAAVAILAIILAVVAYGYYKLSNEVDTQVEASRSAEMARVTAETDLAGLREKLAREEKARLTAEQEAKSALAKLAQEVAARNASEQAAKSADDRAAQIQNSLANAQQGERQAREALALAKQAQETAEQAARDAEAKALAAPKPAG